MNGSLLPRAYIHVSGGVVTFGKPQRQNGRIDSRRYPTTFWTETSGRSTSFMFIKSSEASPSQQAKYTLTTNGLLISMACKSGSLPVLKIPMIWDTYSGQTLATGSNPFGTPSPIQLGQVTSYQCTHRSSRCGVLTSRWSTNGNRYHIWNVNSQAWPHLYHANWDDFVLNPVHLSVLSHFSKAMVQYRNSI